MSPRYSIASVIVIFLIVLIVVAAPAQAQTDTVRIVCVGNSITEGSCTGNAVMDGYPPQLGTLLGDGWYVKNAGVSGRTMLKHGDFPIWIEPLFSEALNSNPDIVMICLGTNDSKPWNWDTLNYKNEFVPDYESMVDTFRNLPSHPQVWVCLPPPAFSGAFSIRDSVIDADIIPMIRQIAADKGCQIVDFNTLMQPHSAVMPDGIHPNTIGMTIMAEHLYTVLTGNPVVRVDEVNCTSGKPVSASGSIDSLVHGGANLVDTSNTTQWIALGYSSDAVVDLGSEQGVDLFRVDFGGAAESNAGYQFRIETAVSPGTWTTVIDRTTRTDSASTILEKTDSITARYVRIVVTGAARPRGDTVSIAGLRVLAANGSAHTPVIMNRRTGGSPSMPRYDIKFQWPNGAQGKMMLYRDKNFGGPAPITGFRNGESYTVTYEYIKTTDVVKYYAVTFHDGVETVSDTLMVGSVTTGINAPESDGIPTGIRLEPSYPNPFNPSTNISFSIPKREMVTLQIFDNNGREVATILRQELPTGNYMRQWKPNDNSSGVYFCRLTVGKNVETKKLVFMK